jgi:hypothetical protein
MGTLSALARIVARAVNVEAPRPPPPPKPAPQPRREVDSFTAATPRPRPSSVVPLTRAEDRATVKASYEARLGRAPTADEVKKGVTFLEGLRAQGKTGAELRSAMEFVIACTPEWQAKDAYRTSLGREGTADEVAKLAAWGAGQAAQGKPVEELRAGMNFLIALSPEWQAKDAYRASLGREGTADEVAKLAAWGAEQVAQGKPVEEMRAGMNFLVALTPEWQAKDAYRASLGREGTADEVAKLSAWGAEQVAQGKPVEEMRAGMNFIIAMSPEWQAKDAYRAMLGREGTPEEIWNLAAWGGQQLAEGRPVPEMRAGMDFLIALSPEWQAKHPRLNSDRDAIYLQQPNGWTCGPTSLAMALAATGVRPANGDTIWELVDALGARSGVGTPGGVSLVADVARRFGVNAEANGSTDPADVRAALERGHGVIVNGHLGRSSGHFLYLSGLDANGDYIVCDPWRPGIQRWNDGDLWDFTHGGPNPPGFAEIWPA